MQTKSNQTREDWHRQNKQKGMLIATRNFRRIGTSLNILTKNIRLRHSISDFSTETLSGSWRKHWKKSCGVRNIMSVNDPTTTVSTLQGQWGRLYIELEWIRVKAKVIRTNRECVESVSLREFALSQVTVTVMWMTNLRIRHWILLKFLF